MSDVRFPTGRSGDRVRQHDWSASSLGPIASWPCSLRTLVRTLLASDVPMMLWWGDDFVHFHNDAADKLLAARGAKAIGLSAREIWSDVWPIVRRANASWKLLFSAAYDDEGEVGGVLVMARETTLEETRAETHAVFMQAPIPIAVLQGPEHLYTLSNPAYETMVGRPTLGKRVLDAFTVDEVGDFVPLLDRVFETGESVTIREAPLHLVDVQGTTRSYFIDATYQPYRDDDGTILGVMAFHNDVTEAVQARNARDQFLALLGHELRNPLAPIATATTLMKMRGEAPKEREIVERQVAHLTRLVEDLLDVSRVARGRIDMQKHAVRIADVIEAAVETVGPLLESRRHALDVHTDQSLYVEGDAARLAQVFSNILGNAAKYTPPGGRIEVHARVEGGEIRVTVTDNGPGIAADLLPRVFDMFVQGAQSIDRAQGGLGLGLALVKNLVTLHQGTVTAANRVSGGTEVTVELRALDRDRPSDAPAAPATLPETSKTSLRILVVDDNQDHVDLLAAFLARIGHTVETAYDGDAALEKLEQFDADLALLDIGLPGMDGYELARRIRRDVPKVKRTIAVTGYGQPRDRELTKAAGFHHHLTKPVNLEQLARIIDER